MKKIHQFLDNNIAPLLLALLLGAPVIFWNAFRYSSPLGYAGMFSLMAEAIINAQFGLPMEIPYYGPNGVPFAYPPVGLYFFAILMKISGNTFILLRFVPPFLSLLALIPLYFISLEVYESKLAGFVTVFLASLSVQLYIPHAWAAGIVRAPAFGFSLLSILFFLRAIKKSNQRNVMFSGLLFGITIMTHLSYAMFVVVWIVFWTITQFRAQNWLIAIKISFLGILIAVPWISLMLFRYGPEIFFGALDSHGNENLFYYLGNIEYLFRNLWGGFKVIINDVQLSFFLVIGIIFQIIKKHLALPLVFLTSIFFFKEDGERFIFTIGYLLIGIGTKGILDFLINWLSKKYLYVGLRVAVCILAVSLIQIWIHGLDQIDNFSPRLTSSTLDIGKFFQEKTPANTTYLALVPQDEAEWLPYLSRRNPLVGQWGSEWLGTYNEQVVKMIMVRACSAEQNLVCLKKFFLEINLEPDYLVILKDDRHLKDLLEKDSAWKSVYENSRYSILENR